MARLTRWAAALLVLAGVGAVGLGIQRWVQRSQTFILQEVAVSGNRLLSTEAILKLVRVDPGVRITAISLADIQRRLESNPYIETALVSRRFPSTLQIEVVERIPVAFLAGSRLFAVDKNGVLLPVLHSTALGSLPVINGVGRFPEKPGRPVPSERVLQALELLKSVRIADAKLYRQLSEVTFSPEKGFVVYFTHVRFPVYFGLGDFFRKAQKTSAFFAEVKREKRYSRLRYVDLRYREQVVAKFR